MTDSSHQTGNDPFEVFYDGDCPLCRREIDMIRRMDRQQRLRLTDISGRDFRTPEKSRDELMRAIHGRDSRGEYQTGVDVFREIYQRLGWRRLVSISRWPVVRSFLDIAYIGFAWVRYRHAGWRERRKDVQRSSADHSSKPAV